MATPLLYTAELDLAEADIPAFRDWYAFRHAPDVYQAGFLTCTCYQATQGDMNFLDIYEMADWSIFETPRYLGMRGRDPYMGPLMEKRRNKAHTVYEQQAIVPDQPGAWFDADWVVVHRFATPPEQDAAIVALLREAAGAVRLRYATRAKDHPRNPTFRPRCMIVAEHPTRPAEPEALVAQVRQRVSLTDATLFVGQRIYPWPDRPPAGRPV